MDDAQFQDREAVIEERLDALEWALENIERIEDRLVKAYVIKLKKQIEEEERIAEHKEGQWRPAPLPGWCLHDQKRDICWICREEAA